MQNYLFYFTTLKKSIAHLCKILKNIYEMPFSSFKFCMTSNLNNLPNSTFELFSPKQSLNVFKENNFKSHLT